MPDKPGEENTADAIVRRLIAQCRNDIKAAWDQVEAAREALGHTRWLRSRWDAHRRTTDTPEESASPPGVDAPPPSGARKRGMREGAGRHAARRARKRSASGL
jgi:hypothetical protein